MVVQGGGDQWNFQKYVCNVRSIRTIIVNRDDRIEVKPLLVCYLVFIGGSLFDRKDHLVHASLTIGEAFSHLASVRENFHASISEKRERLLTSTLTYIWWKFIPSRLAKHALGEPKRIIFCFND